MKWQECGEYKRSRVSKGCSDGAEKLGRGLGYAWKVVRLVVLQAPTVGG